MNIDKDAKEQQDEVIGYIGKAIRKRRKVIQKSQEDLAYDSGIARNYITELEAGKRSFSIRNLVRLSEALDVLPSVLVSQAEMSMLATKTTDNEVFEGDMVFLNYLVNSIGLAFVLTDPKQEDNPIIYANSVFEKMSGYPRDKIIGKNCRFLQGNDRNQEGVLEIRKAITEVKPTVAKLRNYTAKNQIFENQLAIAPIFDERKELINFIGVQTLVS